MAARRIKGAWWVDFHYEDERYRRKSPVDTKRGAEEHERTMRQQLQDGTFEKEEEPEKAPPPTVEEFAKEFLATYAKTNNKPSEVQGKEIILRRHLVPAMGRLRIDQIDARTIERYKASKLAERFTPKEGKDRTERPRFKPKSINNHLAVLQKMLSLAVEWEVIDRQPKMKWLKGPEAEFDFLTFEEAERLIAAGEGEWQTMITVALKTGLRHGELLGLRWDDVDLVAGRLMVRQSVVRGIVGTPKSGKTREIPLSGEALRALKAHRHLRGEMVFCDQDGKILCQSMGVWPLWRACKRAGLRRIRWHALRHTFASHLAMRGVPLKAIQELLGHSTIEMTMRYAHLAPVVHREAVAQLDRPAGEMFGHLMGTGGSPVP